MERKNFKLLLGIIIAAATLVACNIDAPKTSHTSFKTLVVEKSDITVPLKYSARMKGKSDVIITSQASGQLLKSCVKEGEQVKAGQVLFLIDDRQARLTLADAEANLAAAIAMENSAQLEYNSNKNLYDKGIVSSYMLNTAQNEYNHAKAAVAQARSAVNRAKVELSYCTITSPVSGIMATIPATVGAQVSPATELATVSENATMSAKFSVTENEMAEIQSMDIENYIENLPDVTFVMKNGNEYEHKGRVTTTTGSVDKATGSVTCTASFPNPDGKLISGTQGNIIIPYNVKGVIVIPQHAVVRLQDKSLVYKVGSDSCAVSVQVTVVDAATGKDVVVTSGLKPGEKIVTEGSNNVIEGQKVIF